MSEFTIYHNPRCTKSRATLALLEGRGIKPRIVEYLKTPPTARELAGIVGKLGIEAEALVRKGEDVYKTRYAGRQLTAAQWIAAMVEGSGADRAADRRERHTRSDRAAARECRDAARRETPALMRPRSLTEGSISRGLLLFALPILYGNILQSLNGSVNAIWVGRFLGEAALTAAANANAILFLLLGGAFGLSMASTVLVGQYIGAGNLEAAKKVVGTSTTFFFAISILISATGWVFCEPLLTAMNTPADALPFAVSYMQVIFVAMPAMYMYAFVMAVLRGAGDAKTPLYFMLLSVGLDIVLNPLFIFGVGPLPRLGITGAALATLIAQTVSLGALVFYLYRRRHPLVLHSGEQRLLRIDWSIAAP
jgi:arsenate reductase (glutaredoxin)